MTNDVLPDVKLSPVASVAPTYADLCATIDDLKQTVTAQDATLQGVMELLKAINDQITPTLKSVSESPIGKMLGM